MKLKIIAGFLNLILMMGLALFLPAWSLHFWQGWLFLGVFSICTIITTVYFMIRDPELISRRLKAGPVAEKEKLQKWIQGFASVAFLGSMVLPGFDFRFGWSGVPPWMAFPAEAGVLAGYVLIFFVFFHNSFTSATIEVSDQQQLITTGPYAWVRHPMYSGAGLMFLSLPPALGSWFGYIPAFVLILVLVFRLRHEETFLKEHLPGYTEYCTRVKYRLLPGVW